MHEETYRSVVFSPGNGWGWDTESITSQCEGLLQCDCQIQRLPIILDLWWN